MTKLTSSAEQAFLDDLDKKLWNAADRLRSNLDAAVYKHAVLGLIFLKYVSDTFDLRREELEASFRNPKSDYFLDRADFVLANSSMSSNQSGEGDIRRALIKADLVDCMVARPHTRQIPVCRWFLAKNKAADGKHGFRDSRKLGTLFSAGVGNPSLN